MVRRGQEENSNMTRRKQQIFVSLSLLVVSLSSWIGLFPGVLSFANPVLIRRVDAPTKIYDGQHLPDDPFAHAWNNQNQSYHLYSFVYSIQKHRRKNNGTALLNHASRRSCPAYALVHYLTTNKMGEVGEMDRLNTERALTRAMVQGIRLAKSENDYKLIVKLVNAAIQFAAFQPVIQPRIIGEAIEAMVETSVNLGKMKRIWNLLSHNETSNPSYLAAPPSALETNAMLKAFTTRGRVRAAVDLVRDKGRRNQIDSYSLTILFDGLASSLVPDQGTASSLPTLSVKLLSSMLSPCWQWNEAISLLDSIVSHADWNTDLLNNHVYSALLKLNALAGEAMPDHETSCHTTMFWEWIKHVQTPLDHVTCTVLLSGFGSQWKSALSFHQSMKQHNATNSLSIRLLPKPNVYTYSAVISACAKHGQYETAIRLLDELHDDNECEANTIVYNAVLQSLATAVPRRGWINKMPTRRVRREARRRVGLALPIIRIMKSNAARGMDTKPDSATYKSLLALFGQLSPVLQPSDWAMFQSAISLAFGTTRTNSSSLPEDLPLVILERVRADGLPCDTRTYCLTFPLCQSIDVLLRIFDEASHSTSNCSVSQTQLLSSALPHVASLGGICSLRLILHRAMANGATVSSGTVTQLIHSLGRCEATSLVHLLISSTTRTGKEETLLKESIGIPLKHFPPLTTQHFETAIKVCLRGNDVDSARSIMWDMNRNMFEISPVIYQELARMYAVKALQYPKHVHHDLSLIDSTVPAGMAYFFFKSVPGPPLWLAVMVGKSLAKSKLFELAEKVLVNAHQIAIAPRAGHLSSIFLTADNALRLKSLHTAILRSCASCSNVTAALRVCEEIQSFAKSIQENGASSHHGEDISLNMNTIEWKLLLLAAMKSGHWRLCLSTIQVLQPSVEAVRPTNESSTKALSQLNHEFFELSSALNIVVRCLSVRGQYGWIIRVLDDWISWSCRRPPKQAAFLAIRALCARGQGAEVGCFLVRCLTPHSVDPIWDGKCYEIALLVFAITCLYKEGLYDAADEIFLTGVSSYSLPFVLWEEMADSRRKVTLDLHGMNVAVAHSAVRTALRREARELFPSTETVAASDLLIVTGRGRTSFLRMRPVLRPEVQRMLVEEFYPPLSSSSIPGNMGAILVPESDIDFWLAHQREAKRTQLLSVAAALKKVSSDAICAALALSTSGAQASVSSRQPLVNEERFERNESKSMID